MAFRKKIHFAKEWNADIMIVQECEHPKKIFKNKNDFTAENFIWLGDNDNKGIAILSLNPTYSLQLKEINKDGNRWFVPFSINNKINAIAVWAMNHRGNTIENKISATYNTIQNNKAIFEQADFIIGDFNNNIIWDKKNAKKYSIGIFGDILKALEQLDFASVYHAFNNEEMGKESVSTLFWRKNIASGYHIDYCFFKKEKWNQIDNFEIMENYEMLQWSDHVPLFLELK
jgi:exonuclease III